ncbi:hypothetical protein AB9F46_36390, partial [Rhizobium leguminosarum]
RAGKTKLLLHAAGELSGEPACETLEVGKSEQFVEVACAFAFRQHPQIVIDKPGPDLRQGMPVTMRFPTPKAGGQ